METEEAGAGAVIFEVIVGDVDAGEVTVDQHFEVAVTLDHVIVDVDCVRVVFVVLPHVREAQIHATVSVVAYRVIVHLHRFQQLHLFRTNAAIDEMK